VNRQVHLARCNDGAPNRRAARPNAGRNEQHNAISVRTFARYADGYGGLYVRRRKGWALHGCGRVARAVDNEYVLSASCHKQVSVRIAPPKVTRPQPTPGANRQRLAEFCSAYVAHRYAWASHCDLAVFSDLDLRSGQGAAN
jgi:hypothetical protein